jgi:hypothetical protein
MMFPIDGTHHVGGLAVSQTLRVYDERGNVIETHEHAGDFKEP